MRSYLARGVKLTQHPPIPFDMVIGFIVISVLSAMIFSLVLSLEKHFGLAVGFTIGFLGVFSALGIWLYFYAMTDWEYVPPEKVVVDMVGEKPHEIAVNASANFRDGQEVLVYEATTGPYVGMIANDYDTRHHLKIEAQ